MASSAAVTTLTPPTAPGQSDGYTLPVVGLRLPASMVHAGFAWGLAGAVLLGAVDLPVAALVAAGVLIARHRRA